MKVLDYEQIMQVAQHGKIVYRDIEYSGSESVLNWIRSNPPTVRETGDLSPSVGDKLVVLRPGFDTNIVLFAPIGPPDPGIAGSA